LIGALLDEDIYSFISYLEEVKPWGKELLKIIVDLIKLSPSQESTQIYIKICKNPRVHQLEATPELIEASMRYLNENREEIEAVSGILKFSLQNKISYTDFPKKVTRDFQGAFSHQINNFFRHSCLMKNLGESILPNTIYCFTEPLLKQINSDGKLIYSNFHP
jgi:hypothetical protein